jgi:hypothetical protein
LAFDEFTTIVVACGVVLVWYLTGLAYNRKLLGGYWINIRDELVTLGANPRIGKLQPNNVVIVAGALGKHLRNVVITIIVIGRQNPFSYALSKLQKQHDTISIRADLKNEPRMEYELLNKHYPLTSSLLKHAFKDWHQESVIGTEFVYCWKRDATPNFANLKGITALWRISVRKNRPNLLIALPTNRSSKQLGWFHDFETFIAR